MHSEAIQFLPVDEALTIYERLIGTFGGPAGVRDRGLLESADLAGMAAALFESPIMNHDFIDGNKRVPFFATDVFLRPSQDIDARRETDQRMQFWLRSL